MDVESEAITVHGFGPGKYPDSFPQDTMDGEVPEAQVREVVDLTAKYMIRQGHDRTGSRTDLRKFVLADMPAMDDANCAWYNSRTSRWENIPIGYACAPSAPLPSDDNMAEAYRRHISCMMQQAKDEGAEFDSDEEEHDRSEGSAANEAECADEEAGYVAHNGRGDGHREENMLEGDEMSDEVVDQHNEEDVWEVDPALNNILGFEGSGSNYSADA